MEVLRAETRAETRSQDLMEIKLVLSRDQNLCKCHLETWQLPVSLGLLADTVQG